LGTIAFRLSAQSRRGDTEGVGADPPATGCPIDACIAPLTDERTSRLRGCDLRRHEHDAEICCLDPSILPKEPEARKPTLATEGQAQQ
jgi:hypothetical protein